MPKRELAAIASQPAAATLIVAAEPPWRFAAANAAARSYFGRQSDESTEGALADWIDQSIGGAANWVNAGGLAALEGVIQQRSAATFSVPLQKSQEHWLLWPLLDRRGQVTHVVCQHSAAGPSLADEALRPGEDRWQRASEAAALGIWDYDPLGNDFYCSDRSKELFGIPREAKPSYDLFLAALHVDDRQRVDAAVQRALDPAGNAQFDVECRIVGLRDGQVRSIRAIGRAEFEANQAVRLVGVAQDISDRIQTERSLDEADSRKDEFLSTLAHELRNPLNPISVSLEMMELIDSRSEEFEDMRQIMQRQVRQVLRLIDGVLDVSHVARGNVRLHRRRVLLSRMIEEALESNRAPIEEAGLRLELKLTPMPLALEVDSARLQQVISNLLHNAVRFTEAGGVITLTTAKDAHWGVIRVRDTGIGMSAEMLPRVFEMFMKGDNSLTRVQSGGLGIGLTLVKRLVQLHGGQIEAASAGPGQGSEFTVRLPLATSSERSATSPERPYSLRRLKPRRVLVVDDTHDAAIMLGKLLTALGQQVDIVHDGHAALAAARRNKPDLVISDIAMPGMDGYEFAQRLRAQESFRNLTLVALTGYGQEHDRRRALEVGFDQHLVKPITLKTLETLLTEMPTGS